MPLSPVKRSLLLVDASRKYAALVEQALRQVAPGLAVFPLTDGQHAIEHLALCGSRYPLPDLVLLDRVLAAGGPDGCAVLAAVRRMEALAGMPVLIVSGSDEAQHVARARDVGADGYLVKPVEERDFAVFARAVLAWRREESWRSFGGAAAGRQLAAGGAVVRSTAMEAMPPAGIIDLDRVPPAHDPGVVVQVFERLRDLVKQTLDPVELAIGEACRKHCIPPSHARGRGQDQVTVANRHAVICELFDHGYSDRVILENFLVSARQVERLRAAWRAKGGGVLAVRKS